MGAVEPVLNGDERGVEVAAAISWDGGEEDVVDVVEEDAVIVHATVQICSYSVAHKLVPKTAGFEAHALSGKAAFDTPSPGGGSAENIVCLSEQSISLPRPPFFSLMLRPPLLLFRVDAIQEPTRQ